MLDDDTDHTAEAMAGRADPTAILCELRLLGSERETKRGSTHAIQTRTPANAEPLLKKQARERQALQRQVYVPREDLHTYDTRQHVLNPKRRDGW